MLAGQRDPEKACEPTQRAGSGALRPGRPQPAAAERRREGVETSARPGDAGDRPDQLVGRDVPTVRSASAMSSTRSPNASRTIRSRTASAPPRVGAADGSDPPPVVREPGPHHGPVVGPLELPGHRVEPGLDTAPAGRRGQPVDGGPQGVPSAGSPRAPLSGGPPPCGNHRCGHRSGRQRVRAVRGQRARRRHQGAGRHGGRAPGGDGGRDRRHRHRRRSARIVPELVRNTSALARYSFSGLAPGPASGRRPSGGAAHRRGARPGRRSRAAAGRPRPHRRCHRW